MLYCESGAPVPCVVFYHGDMYEENFNVLSTQNCTNPVSIILGKAVVLQFGDLRMNILIFLKTISALFFMLHFHKNVDFKALLDSNCFPTLSAAFL